MAQLSIGTAYSEAATFVAREKKLLAPLVLALMVVPVTVSQLVQPADPFSAADGVRPWMVLALLSLLIGLVGQMAVMRLAMGSDRSLGATIGLALRRLPATLGAFILFFLMVGVVLIPLIMVMTVARGGAEQPSGGINTLILLMILGLIPRILLAPALAMDQPLGPWGLVKAAWSATRGRYLRILFFFLLFMVASLVFALAVSAVVGSLTTVTLGKPDPLTVSRLLISLVGGLVQGLVATLYAAMIGRITLQLPRGVIKGI